MTSLRDSKYDKELNYIAQLGAFLLKADAAQRDPSYRFTGPGRATTTLQSDCRMVGSGQFSDRLACCSAQRTAATKALESIRVEHVIDAARELEEGARSSDYVARGRLL